MNNSNIKFHPLLCSYTMIIKNDFKDYFYETYRDEVMVFALSSLFGYFFVHKFKLKIDIIQTYLKEKVGWNLKLHL